MPPLSWGYESRPARFYQGVSPGPNTASGRMPSCRAANIYVTSARKRQASNPAGAQGHRISAPSPPGWPGRDGRSRAHLFRTPMHRVKARGLQSQTPAPLGRVPSRGGQCITIGQNRCQQRRIVGSAADERTATQTAETRKTQRGSLGVFSASFASLRFEWGFEFGCGFATLGSIQFRRRSGPGSSRAVSRL